ncbi:MAG TPA: hypothetical protein VGE35_03300 [Candidatus Paceibacterota bacterium]
MHQVETAAIPTNARAVIDAYLALPVGTKPSCPYYNNRRFKNRGGLRVMIGKGSPAEIVEEATIMAKLARTDIQTLATDKLKQFLVENGLGVDCSGFAYHVLNALALETKGKGIASYVTSMRSGFIGSILARLRPAENLGVNSFRNDKNSSAISAADAKPGDIVTFIGTGKDKTYNHILVITAVERSENGIRLSYAHSYAWPSDGLYDTGVREGDILIRDNDILAGTWKERSVTGADNYTYQSAADAKEVSVRRLKFAI